MATPARARGAEPRREALRSPTVSFCACPVVEPEACHEGRSLHRRRRGTEGVPWGSTTRPPLVGAALDGRGLEVAAHGLHAGHLDDTHHHGPRHALVARRALENHLAVTD